MSVWTAISGAAKYVEAMATGDIAHENEQVRRASICAFECDSAKRYRLPILGTVYGTCGAQFTDTTRSNTVAPTCGCLVFHEEQVDEFGMCGGENWPVSKPAGKTCVRSERCPQGRW